MRADARRNRARILEAAGQAFAAEGLGVSLDEIARRAEVGPGTVHRHFPTKEALYEAVIANHLEQLIVQAREALAADRAGSGFFPFLRQLIGEARAKQDLTDALAGAGVNLTDATRQTAVHLRQIFAELLASAQKAGVVRADVDGEDVQAIVLAAVSGERHRADNTRPGRLGDLVLDGLRP
ncbi:TetR/AcrR family transcriptional regulator [Microbispora bryophytorum]|uniref:TetR/AcrR family transcriptional regulator n=1 Tax=Microbispora bryophytorum TaxID=1460882 RepID=UPI0033D5A7BF